MVAIVVLAAAGLGLFVLGERRRSVALRFLGTGIACGAGLCAIGVYVVSEAASAGLQGLLAGLGAECAVMVLRLGDLRDHAVEGAGPPKLSTPATGPPAEVPVFRGGRR